jgi:hypothetical protein
MEATTYATSSSARTIAICISLPATQSVKEKRASLAQSLMQHVVAVMVLASYPILVATLAWIALTKH